MFLKYFCSKVYAETAETSTVNEDEIMKFQQRAKGWWNRSSGLLAMNDVRVPFIRDGLLSAHTSQCGKTEKPLKGFSILDVGCGVGFLAEPLARLGANVTGLDPAPEMVKTAEEHAELDSELKGNLEYICATAEDLSKGDKKYDSVVCSEVIEHVDNVDHFVKSCVNLVQDNGSIFFTTINRTIFSYCYAIVLAEYVFRVIPRGTHEWKKFIKPAELKGMLQSNGCKTLSIQGAGFNLFTKKFSRLPFLAGFYELHAIKENPTAKNADI